MRAIKFRAWREAQKFMLHPYELIDLFSICGSAGGIADPDGVVWMQFTGETDANNKEIYEYDIVKLTLENATWHEPTVYYKLVQLKDGCWIAGDNPLVRKEYGPHSTEVVGNLFETPELLSGS